MHLKENKSLKSFSFWQDRKICTNRRCLYVLVTGVCVRIENRSNILLLTTVQSDRDLCVFELF